MTIRRLASTDFNGTELKNFLIDILSADPGSPANARAWYNSTDGALRARINGVTVDLGSGMTTEQVQDIVGAMVTGNTETGITVTYDDTAGVLNFVLSDEYLQDVVGAMLVGTETGISVSYDDANARIDFVVAALNLLPVPTGDLSINSNKLTNVAAGVAPTDGVNLGQLNSVSSGIDWKASVRAATTAAGTLASSFENGDAIDGVTLATGDRILIKDQATGSENGVYTVNASGAPTRATDADTSAEVTGGLAVWVNEGTTNADTGWVLTTNDPITLGTTALVFTQFSGLGQITVVAPILKSGNQLSLDTAVVVRKAVGALTGGATSEVLTHNLNTRDVDVTIRNNASPWEEVEVEVEATSVNTVTIRAAGNLPASYRWLVIG